MLKAMQNVLPVLKAVADAGFASELRLGRVAPAEEEVCILVGGWVGGWQCPGDARQVRLGRLRAARAPDATAARAPASSAARLLQPTCWLWTVRSCSEPDCLPAGRTRPAFPSAPLGLSPVLLPLRLPPCPQAAKLVRALAKRLGASTTTWLFGGQDFFSVTEFASHFYGQEVGGWEEQEGQPGDGTLHTAYAEPSMQSVHVRPCFQVAPCAHSEQAMRPLLPCMLPPPPPPLQSRAKQTFFTMLMRNAAWSSLSWVEEAAGGEGAQAAGGEGPQAAGGEGGQAAGGSKKKKKKNLRYALLTACLHTPNNIYRWAGAWRFGAGGLNALA